MTSQHPSNAVWDGIYGDGQFLRYPYELAVRLVKKHQVTDGFPGVVLDHGCGSGNHLELFARSGIAAHGIEISSATLPLVRARFLGANLVEPPVTIVDLDKPLAPQLPRYSHLFSWGAVHYNHKQRVLADIETLIDGLPSGGCFILVVPSVRDVVATTSDLLPDGSRRIAVGRQAGAIVTVPANEDELRAWCPAISIRDVGRFGWVIGGVESEFLFVYGTKT